MIGIYDYTVILTYLSLLSASVGIAVTLSGGGSPYLGIFFLLFCGLCDAFDGRVASTKKNRSYEEKRLGIQIDSLSDLVAFGVLPASIGYALFRKLTFISKPAIWICVLVYAILLFYVLAALIRLAYFNVTEEERQEKESGTRKAYTGLPVTSSAIIFPSIMLLHFITPLDITCLYFVAILGVAFAFLLKFQLKKLDMRGILYFVLIGALEFLLLFALKFFR